MTDRTVTEPADTGSVPQHAQPEGVSAANNVVIWLLLSSTFVVFLNETILSVGIAAIGESFDVPESTSQWVSTSFMLTMAVVIPLTGYLIRRFTLRQLYLAAMGLFTAGTVVAAMTPETLFPMLVGGRVLQAAGTAIMMPVLMTTLMTLVPPWQRGRIMGRVSVVMSVAPAVGPVVGGVILQAFGWHYTFWLVLPISIAALVLGALRLRNVTETKRTRLDWLSVPLSAIAFAGLIFGLSSLGEAARGVALLPPWIPITVGAIFCVLFVARQLVLQRTDRALLDLRTFRSRTFTLSVIMFVIASMAMFGTIILLPLFAQRALQLDPALTGAIMLPGGILMAVMAPIVGRVYDSRGPRVLVIPGALLVSVVLWGFTLLSPATPWWMLLIGSTGLNVGLALMFTPLFSTALGSLTPDLYSHGSATISMIQQVAGALGTAIFVTVLTVQSQALTAAGADEIEAYAGGTSMAFLAGGVISIALLISSFFISKPAASLEAASTRH